MLLAVCYRIAGLRRAYRWVYSTEEINSIMALTYWPYFGNGMAADVRFGVKYGCIRSELSPERSKLSKLRANLVYEQLFYTLGFWEL